MISTKSFTFAEDNRKVKNQRKVLMAEEVDLSLKRRQPEPVQRQNFLPMSVDMSEIFSQVALVR